MTINASTSAAAAGSSAQAERQAVNTICQGSAADLVKLAMIQLHKQLQQRLPAESCRLLLQVRCRIQDVEQVQISPPPLPPPFPSASDCKTLALQDTTGRSLNQSPKHFQLRLVRITSMHVIDVFCEHVCRCMMSCCLRSGQTFSNKHVC